jgi:hypothetical protein
MAKYAVNYNGLRKRDTYEQAIDYIQFGQKHMTMPSRYWMQLRNSPYMTQLDGEGVIEMEKQQPNQMKGQERENEIRRLGMSMHRTAASIRSVPESFHIGSPRGSGWHTPAFTASMVPSDRGDPFLDDLDEEIAKQAQLDKERKERANMLAEDELSQVRRLQETTVATVETGASSSSSSGGVKPDDVASTAVPVSTAVHTGTSSSGGAPTQVDFTKYGITFKSSAPEIPKHFWQNLPGDDKALLDSLKQQYKGKNETELKAIYKNLTGISYGYKVGVAKLIGHIAYIRTKSKDN